MADAAPKRVWFRHTGGAGLILLLHGFGGRSHETFGLLPAFVAGDPDLSRWDLVSVGYPTSLGPDFSGVWKADPDLHSMAGYLQTLVNDADFADYRQIAFIAHSMGGLIVQRAILGGGFEDRVNSVLLYGTPSGGLHKARLGKLFKRQVRDMAPNGEFISRLREEWRDSYASDRPFPFWSVAGLSDEFVPRGSSHGPFGADGQVCKWVAGDHLSMVKPDSAEDDSVQLIRALLTRDHLPEPSPAVIAAVAAEELSDRLLAPARGEASWEASVREAAFALEAQGQQGRAIELLEATGYQSPELKGMLGGRLKRRWLADPDECGEAGERALVLYSEALAQAERDGAHDQAFYNGINVAFMTLALKEDTLAAREAASTTLSHAEQHAAKHAKPDMWLEATRGEAQLYLGRTAPALEAYRRALALDPDPRQRRSMAQQAVWAARLLDLPETEERLLAVFRA